MYDKLGKLLKLSSIPDAALQQAPSDISCLLEEKTRFPAGRLRRIRFTLNLHMVTDARRHVVHRDRCGMGGLLYRPHAPAWLLAASRPLRQLRSILSFQSAGMEGGSDGVYNSIHSPIVRI